MDGSGLLSKLGANKLCLSRGPNMKLSIQEHSTGVKESLCLYKPTLHVTIFCNGKAIFPGLLRLLNKLTTSIQP